MAALSGMALIATARREPPPLPLIWPQAELWAVLVWYALVVLLAALSLANGLELVNGFTNWFFLVLAPLGLLTLARKRGVSLRDTLRSVGLTRANMKDAVKLAVWMMPLTIPLLYSVGDQQRAAIQMIFHTPFRATIAFLVSFVLALLTAGFGEEFFFRGILQPRLAACLGSEWRGLLVAAFLFGLLHLPLYFFSPFEPTHGNLVWSVAGVITEPMLSGVLLGMVWARTRNLAAPVLLHTFVNALAMMAALKIGTG